MGTTTTPKYVVHAYFVNGRGHRVYDVLDWSGKPSQKKLEEMRKFWNESFMPGGINFTVSKALGYCTHYYRLVLVTNNRYNTPVIIANAPAFEVA